MKAASEAIDRVVGHRLRAVSSGVDYLERVCDIQLFARLHRIPEMLPLDDLSTRCIGVDHVLRIHQITVVGDEPRPHR